MSSPDAMAWIEGLSDVALHEGAPPGHFERLAAEAGVRLPADHVALLSRSNGVEADAGYLRLFGLYDEERVLEAVWWNHPSTWKNAWAGAASPYWCFAETAFGDQFAYRLEDLSAGRETVYFLEVSTLEPKLVADTFAVFMQSTFRAEAEAPSYFMTRPARERLGPLELTDHLIFAPSVQFAPEHIDRLMKMFCAQAMIIHGDIATQLAAKPNGRVMRVSYEDHPRGAPYYRLIWADEPMGAFWGVWGFLVRLSYRLRGRPVPEVEPNDVDPG